MYLTCIPRISDMCQVIKHFTNDEQTQFIIIGCNRFSSGPKREV